jgi:arylsulfatase A-like enzyme
MTPTLDALAAQGVRFDRAYTDVPLTTPAHASILTGLHPPHHGVHTNGGTALADDVTTLAEVLEGKGYATAAIASAFVTSRAWNLDQGFATYDDQLTAATRWAAAGCRSGRRNDTVDKAIAWLSSARPSDRPFFLWVHFYDAHAPYEPPRPWPNGSPIPTTARSPSSTRSSPDSCPRWTRRRAARGPSGSPSPITARRSKDEHGEPSHGAFLYEPTMHVPFSCDRRSHSPRASSCPTS